MTAKSSAHSFWGRPKQQRSAADNNSKCASSSLTAFGLIPSLMPLVSRSCLPLGRIRVSRVFRMRRLYGSWSAWNATWISGSTLWLAMMPIGSSRTPWAIGAKTGFCPSLLRPGFGFRPTPTGILQGSSYSLKPLVGQITAIQ